MGVCVGRCFMVCVTHAVLVHGISRLGGAFWVSLVVGFDVVV